MALAPNLPPHFNWFLQTQMDPLVHGGIPAWFHGAISRAEAEELLASKPLGSFLLRVSHSHSGYTLSYKAQSGCRHFIVEILQTGGFLIPGQQTVHASLDALVAFHQKQPLWPHQEVLTQACGQKDPEHVDYGDLLPYSNALIKKTANPPPVPSQSQHPPSCRSAAPKQVFPRQEARTPPAEAAQGPAEEAHQTTRVLLDEVGHKLWGTLKTLPQAGKKVLQQLKDLPRGPAHVPPQSQNIYTELHHVEPAPPRAWVPEEYGRPPPFAPGFS